MTFLGFREDVGDLLAASDLVVLPSLREGLSIALLEAMAAGKPIIATSIGSQREVASQADMARLVPPADARALSEAIVRLAADQERDGSAGSNARTLYESRYTEERMLEDLQAAISRPVGAKCPKRRLRSIRCLASAQRAAAYRSPTSTAEGAL